METMIARCAGIDVHQGTMVVTVQQPGPAEDRQVTTQTFADDDQRPAGTFATGCRRAA